MHKQNTEYCRAWSEYRSESPLQDSSSSSTSSVTAHKMTQAYAAEEPSAFDSIIEQIGNAGRYQKRFNLTFNFLLVILAVMPYFNLVISLATPEHWCHVPGREDTNYTMDEWKDLTIPKELDSRGVLSHSKCHRFAYSNHDNLNLDSEKFATKAKIVKCDRGWDYDRTWYESTAPMQNDWVCDNAMVTEHTLAFGCFGEVIGTLILGQFADGYGRRPVFFVTVVILIVGRVMSSLTSTWTYVFFISSMIGSLPFPSVFEGPLVIAMEISRVDDRALISMMKYLGWNVGMIIMPLLMWWLRDWVVFLLVTTLPCVIFLFSWPWMIESPRWLASKGKIKRCIKELEKVAITNKTEMPNNAEAILNTSFEEHGLEKHYTVLGLFSSPRLAKNSFLLVCCWTILLMTYMSLTINVKNLGGNPFMNYLYQTFAELPASIVGRFVSDRFGRRWTSLTSFLLTSCTCIPLLFLVNDTENTLVINGLCIFLKFTISLAFYSVNLQSMEIYPTCVRQTGISVGVIFGSGVGAASPYIVNLGMTVSAMLPYLIYTICSGVAAFCCLFLPETYGHMLPETLEDASNFGKDQDFWGRTKHKNLYKDGA